MCRPPWIIQEREQIIMNHIINKRFDLVEKEIKIFNKKKYSVFFRKITKEEYESPSFNQIAKDIISKIKEKSNDKNYHGCVLFTPSFLKGEKRMKQWDLLWEWTMHFNNRKCLIDYVINRTDHISLDNNLYIMLFYFNQPEEINIPENKIYDKIKSKFIKNKINGMKFTVKNRKYIRDLMDIELIILEQYTSTGTGYIHLHLKDKYPKEYEAIYKELDPKQYEKIIKKELKELEKEKHEEKREIEQEKKGLQKQKQAWKNLGGKI